ncbi:ribonuclease D [Microlunatus endophyticus]|uniref:Ribonuclease D n=1 Tax=Microlunatus endophyticus TaxID=1716077 RepID=A0A917W011_9ACTN|nr:ribonuclease D [Microlunatus endophyticus]GGL51791.1 ribonuclease D [Microlunatus endophyticus]
MTSPTTPDRLDPDEPDAAGEDDVRLLTEPADGLGDVVADQAHYRDAVAALGSGTGPVAIDAERAHGFRYSNRAYLIQLRRQGSGTVLIDPVALAPAGRPADLGDLDRLIIGAEWIIHAAHQDLPCLVEIGLVPSRIFDTELAGRLLGYPRVNLGTLIEEFFGVRLLKEHSAADWSKRPLPTDWLNYAALDVELLIELREAMAVRLDEAGKTEWARQEFEYLAVHSTDPAEPRPDPWRRTSGIHRIRSRRGLAVVAELWLARDEIARRTDRTPGKILPDLAIAEIAALRNPTPQAVRDLPTFRRRSTRRYETNWIAAIERAQSLPESQLPPLHRHSDGPPQQARLWAGRDPVAATRLAAVREALTARSAELTLPVENLLTPDYVRRLAWRPPEPLDESSVDSFLAGLGARAWQREIVVPLLTPLLDQPAGQ